MIGWLYELLKVTGHLTTLAARWLLSTIYFKLYVVQRVVYTFVMMVGHVVTGRFKNAKEDINTIRWLLCVLVFKTSLTTQDEKQ